MLAFKVAARNLVISIHAPREGGDFSGYPGCALCSVISIHAPREGGRRCEWGGHPRDWSNFNPRPPRGGRLNALRLVDNKTNISIHAPREGGDRRRPGSACQRGYFNPRPPRGGRPEAVL